ncbi:helicase-related protein [Muricoccus pecuniae]|uniref:ATP-dependent RNA helicase SUPV3L1/SUV3 n=1 Tax=Muricoccus pecuniae TaxID=693023 RepID=A0A840YGL9_9PROT|nr:helicase-related protein [Roseomonas pecuniae]MBB5693014.1 ATP-dependent RNA helicase SUPV3L1/SUV3 [Roseomonas pecuniae]
MTDESMTPGEGAAEAAIGAAGYPVEPHERAPLLRALSRIPSPGAEDVRHALCEIRRRGWAARITELAHRAGRAWISAADARAAAAAIMSPDATEEALLAALGAVTATRLRDAGPDAEAALRAVMEGMADAGGSLSIEQLDDLARSVATAWDLDPEHARRFRKTAIQAEERRRHELREAQRAARERRREEVRRLREWERGLVDIEDVPGLLGCTPKEAQRWVTAGLVPVARRIPAGRGGKGERRQFDPAVLAPLRAEVAGWRSAEREAGDARRGAGERGGGLAAPAIPGGRAANAAVARVAALDRYAGHFATARALDRRITLVTGPTNSGKSHTALDRLASAESGHALAPLRLLAHEFREALEARGVAASLSTGEERIRVPGSRHLAATVEMCPFGDPVDVAVVDEAQMLHDPDRGAAWTAAIMGVPAREVFVLGAPESVPMVRRIAKLCGDPVEEVSLQRKSPLVAARNPVALGDLGPGDALVAFSRRDVLQFREELIKRGRRVAVVYGALSPEVRLAEAARFRNGDADILVATDAIGMGLNLPIRRVVFSALRKFDGTASRDLKAQEVKQIGGRAGRYGQHEEGIVAVLAGAGSPGFVRGMLSALPESPADLRPQVQPDAAIVAAVAAEIGSDSLFGVLARIKRAVLRRDDPNYRLADMTQPLAIASAIDGIPGLSLLDRWTYATCPVDERDSGVARLSRWAMEHGAGRPVSPPEAGHLPPPHRAAGGPVLEKAEKVYKRLVAWRWLSLRFPDAYPDREAAQGESDRLDAWIEEVLRHQRRGRSVHAA